MKPYKILVAGSDIKTLEQVYLPLRVRGFNVEHLVSDAATVAREIPARRPDILFLDGALPGAAEMITAFRQSLPSLAVAAIAGTGGATERDLAGAGAIAVLGKPIGLEELLLAAGRALGHRETGAEAVNMSRGAEHVRESCLDTARMLVNLVENIQPALGGHCKRVAFFARAAGGKLGLPKIDLLDLEIAGLLHDMGKLTLPEQLANTALGKLKQNEITLIHQHPVFAQAILSISAEFKGPAAIIRSHLEHLDGTGFPDRLDRESIPPASKILGVANAYDELKQRRLFTLEVFSSEHSKEEFAMAQLHQLAGRHFDAAIIAALEEVVYAVAQKIRGENVTVERLAPGMMVSRDIVTKDGKLLVAHGLMLNAPQIMRVRAFYEMGLLPREIAVERHVKYQ